MLRKLSNFIFGPFFDQYMKILEKEIVPSCESLLDVGCGAESPIRYFSSKVPKTVGLDAHLPSIERSRLAGIHREYARADVMEVGERFGEKTFDCVLLSDLIEHLPKEKALQLIAAAEKIARKKVIIFTPNGFLKQGEFDENPYQVHVCGWTPKEMRSLGYQVRGVNGWKPLRTENARIAWWPVFFWGKVSLLTQPLVFHAPSQAFHLYCVKDFTLNA